MFQLQIGPWGSSGCLLIEAAGAVPEVTKKGPNWVGGDGPPTPRSVVDGTVDRNLRRELKALIRSTPDMTFSDIEEEARSRDDGNNMESAAHCYQATQPPVDLQQLKKDIKDEVAAEIRDQMSTITHEVIKELKAELGLGVATPSAPVYALPLPPSNGQPHCQGHGPARYPRQPRRRPRNTPSASTTYHFNRYDKQEQPICRNCDMAGHIHRHCPQRQNPDQNRAALLALNY